MKVGSVKDFFHKHVSMTSAIMPEKYKLTHTETMYLVECCMYHYNGGDLSNMKKLSEHMLDIKFFTREKDVSLYKYKISTKKWAKTGRNVFELPEWLSKKKGDKLEYTFYLTYEDDISDRQDVE